ncbi:MAG: four helix bundle protein [Candidatus Methylacidiphilales bacterium]|nr:four helix bundle protein [Candidatus Methylacidiphilales bacterium]
MAYKSFEDLEVWQRGCRMSVDLFLAFEKCRFPNLKSQIERAGLSVASNIAEGAERGGTKEFSQFLKIAKGSSGEVRTQLYIAQKLKAIDVTEAKRLVKESKEISAMLEGLRKSVHRSA